MASWVACGQEPNLWLRWMECHPALGGYFTLLGVVAAIWAGSATIRAENKRLAARGRVIAYRLAPSIVRIKGDAVRALTILASRKISAPTIFPSLQHLLAQFSIRGEIPQDIFGESWTLPDHVSSAAAQLQSALEDHGQLVEGFGLEILVHDEAAINAVADRLEVSLERVVRLANAVGAYCAAVSDRTVLRRRRHERLKTFLSTWKH